MRAITPDGALVEVLPRPKLPEDFWMDCLITDRQIGILLLGTYTDMSDRRIGRALGINHATVGREKARAMEKLQQHLA